MRFADRDVVAIHAVLLFAQDVVITGLLERRVLRNGERSGFLRQFAIGNLTLARRVVNCAVVRGALTGWNTPRVGRSRNQHAARARPGLAQRAPRRPNAEASAGGHVAIFWIEVGLLDFYPRPIGVEFLSKNHRQRCPRPLAHFRARNHKANLAARFDLDVSVRSKSFRGRAFTFRGEIKSDHKAYGSGCPCF